MYLLKARDSDVNYYNWIAKYASLTVNKFKRLEAFKKENHYLQEIVADQAYDIRLLKGF